MSINDFDKIIDNLYLGDAHPIQPNFFKLIVNCCPDVKCKYTDEDLHNVFYIKIYDDKSENLKLIDILIDTNILDTNILHITQTHKRSTNAQTQ